ncbi:MAG: hypothetical protein GQ547_07655 [Methylophaga sp.]|nr:hypothetical protein [Methylophaga sp.]
MEFGFDDVYDLISSPQPSPAGEGVKKESSFDNIHDLSSFSQREKVGMRENKTTRK